MKKSPLTSKLNDLVHIHNIVSSMPGRTVFYSGPYGGGAEGCEYRRDAGDDDGAAARPIYAHYTPAAS